MDPVGATEEALPFGSDVEIDPDDKTGNAPYVGGEADKATPEAEGVKQDGKQAVAEDEVTMVEEVQVSEVFTTQQSQEASAPQVPIRARRGGRGGQAAIDAAAELEAELRAIMGSDKGLTELLETYVDAAREADEDESDEEWAPELRRACANCTRPFSLAETHCPLCKEHFESGILTRGHKSSRKFAARPRDDAAAGGGPALSDIASSAPSGGAGSGDAATTPSPGVLASATAIGFDERMMLHEETQSPAKPIPHPERPARLRAIMAGLSAEGLFPGRCVAMPCREAMPAELSRVHTTDHIATVEASALAEHSIFTPDTYANEHSALAARLAAGTGADMAVAIVEGRIRNGVALVRPPGHHAESEAIMGFCLHNNAAVAARAAQAAGAARVMILDWDVHHGNGTQEIFLADPSVLYVSLHRHEGGDFYPGTGAASEVGGGPAAGFTVNIPWPVGGIGDGDYVSAFCHVVLPIAYQFKPDLIVISAGFDAAKGDPLGGCKVTPAGYAHLTALLAPVVGGRLLVVLEGGYNLRSISASTAAVTKVLLGDAPPPLASASPTPAGLFGIAEAVTCLAPYWPGLAVPSMASPRGSPFLVTHPPSPSRGAHVDIEAQPIRHMAAAAAEAASVATGHGEGVLDVIKVEEISVEVLEGRGGGDGGPGGSAAATAGGGKGTSEGRAAHRGWGTVREAKVASRAASIDSQSEGQVAANGGLPRKRRRRDWSHMWGPVWWNFGHKRALYPHWQRASMGIATHLDSFERRGAHGGEPYLSL